MKTRKRPARASTELLVVFIDLTRFAAQMAKSDMAAVADTLDEYYERTGRAVEQAGGRTVKFIGDATLAVFPESAVDEAVAMLLALKDTADRDMIGRGWECRLTAKAHFGPVIAGDFGERGAKRYDVIGATVNIAATLDARGVTLSAEAFRKLSPPMRKHFRKHPSPTTYIRTDDARPVGWKGNRAIWG